MTFSLGSGAWTGASYTLIGTDSFGSISITTGTGTSNNTMGTFTFGTPIYTNALKISFSPINANAQGLSNPVQAGAGTYGNGMKQPSFTMTGSSNIVDSTTYQWAYSAS